MKPDSATDMPRRMAFIPARGLPWDQDPLYDHEQAILRLQGREEASGSRARHPRRAAGGLCGRATAHASAARLTAPTAPFVSGRGGGAGDVSAHAHQTVPLCNSPNA